MNDSGIRYNKVRRDWQNVFVITGVCYIGVLFYTYSMKRNVRPDRIHQSGCSFP